jgi:NADH-quinone oxidoreductase subunit N
MLGGVVVSTRLGLQATVFYLAVYMFMNLAAFGVVVARERETGLGDDIAALEGIGVERPWLAWPMTVAMLGLAGIPATAGFIGKVYLIDALVDGDYTWLGVLIVVGSMISLAYYLKVVAAMWMRPAREPKPAIAGAALDLPPEEVAPPRVAGVETMAVAAVFGAASLFFGIWPTPLFDLVKDVGEAFGLL